MEESRSDVWGAGDVLAFVRQILCRARVVAAALLATMAAAVLGATMMAQAGAD